MWKKKVKICLASSSGGHFEQLMMLKPLIEKYDGYVVTEKIGYDIKAVSYTHLDVYKRQGIDNVGAENSSDQKVDAVLRFCRCILDFKCFLQSVSKPAYTNRIYAKDM